ncbi:MAG: 50S ribosomal protein L25/general stress protein Ctc [Actinomycetota bacterium]|nr:50S ribosomal protein L25/general stress protein Ctc [Actinomycetota bacterium]
MAEVRIDAEIKQLSGTGVARKLRAQGKVPAVIYGRGIETTAIQVNRRELATALNSDAGMNVLLDLQIEGKSTLALTRELQRDPVKGTLLHADFVRVDRTQAVEVEVPIHVVGNSPGVNEGGVLENPLFTVHVRCLPTEVPEFVAADISGLSIGDSLRVEDLPSQESFEILTDPETVVATVLTPVSEEELEAMEAAAAIEAAGGVEALAEAAEEEPSDEEAAASDQAEDAEPGEGEPQPESS